MKDYLIKECGVKIHHEPITIKEDNKTIFIGHGDGLGPGEKSFKIIKKIFKIEFVNGYLQRIHPNTALTIAHFWSKK